jgi:hypothetical protein
MAFYCLQRAYCQNCCLASRDRYFAIFAAVARVDKVLKCRNFGNIPARWAQPRETRAIRKWGET